MLTDIAIKRLKPKDKSYKVADRDGMYVAVLPSGAISFRYDYRLNGRRETLTLGAYGPGGLTLAEARERCLVARKTVSAGQSPAQEKQRAKRRAAEALTIAAAGARWFEGARMADSTRSMRKAIFDRDILPSWKNRLLSEITPDDLRGLCAKVKERGAPATAIHVRDIVKQIYGHAILHGEKIANPADEVGPASIATFVPKDRALSPLEVRILFDQIEHVATLPTIRLGLRLVLLTMVRKSELLDATWDEVDFGSYIHA
ncbi:Prophage integrase IntS [Roseomonas sp. CECT 9278]|nr:integrase arm-type DNA-binding domain-containing protein [Roseomonas sp. CECT 9278]CAH0179048.1 Prophage integrase IntS [Roseomonas sp. CECT 9278]